MFCRRLRAVDDVVERKRENARLSFLINNGDVLNPLRHSASVVQKSPGVAARLISTAPARVKIGKASSFGGLEIRASKTKHTHPLTSPADLWD